MSDRNLRTRLRRSKRLSQLILTPSPKKKTQASKRTKTNIKNKKKSLSNSKKKSSKNTLVSSKKTVNSARTVVPRRSSLSQIKKRHSKENTENLNCKSVRRSIPKSRESLSSVSPKPNGRISKDRNSLNDPNNNNLLNDQMNNTFSKKRRKVSLSFSLPCTSSFGVSMQRKNSSLTNRPKSEVSSRMVKKKSKKISKSTSLPSISNAENSSVMNSASSMNGKLENIPLDDLLFVTKSVRKTNGPFYTNKEVYQRISSQKLSNKKENKEKSGNKKKKEDNIQLDTLLDHFSVSTMEIPEKKKVPGKNSLKRKRWIFNEINAPNAGHEDDLLENLHLTPLKKYIEVDTESEASSAWSIATPKCGFQLSPFVPKKVPIFKDCFSPSELKVSRKKAEEFMYRNNKKKFSTDKPTEVSSDKSILKPFEKEQVFQLLTTPAQKKKKQKQITDEFLDDEEDDYVDEEDEY